MRNRKKKSDIPMYSEEIRLKSQGSAAYGGNISSKNHSKRKRHLAKGKVDDIILPDVEMSPEDKFNQKIQRLIEEARENLKNVQSEAEAALQEYNDNVDNFLDEIRDVYTKRVVIDNKLRSLCELNSTNLIFKDFKSLVRAVVTGKVDPCVDEGLDDICNESSIRKFRKKLASKEEVLLYEIGVLRTDVLKCRIEVEKAEHSLAKLLAGKHDVDSIDTEHKDTVGVVAAAPTLKREEELNMYIENSAQHERYDHFRQPQPKTEKKITERIRSMFLKLKALMRMKSE